MKWFWLPLCWMGFHSEQIEWKNVMFGVYDLKFICEICGKTHTGTLRAPNLDDADFAEMMSHRK